MIRTDFNDLDIDASKKATYLYYLALATQRHNNRQLLHRQAEIGLKKLSKLDTKHIHKHMDLLQGHLDHISLQEQHIIEQQKEEEQVHKSLKFKINILEDKLGKYLNTQKGRKKRIKELEDKIEKKFETKREKIAALKNDLKNLTLMYERAHKSRKHSKKDIERIHNRINDLKKKVQLMN